MKTFFSQNKILIWVMIFLLLLNISTIGSIIFFKSRVNTMISPPKPPLAHKMGIMQRDGRFMKEYLGLNEEQFIQFSNTRFEFQQKAHSIAMELRQKRMELFDELKKSNPGERKIRKISEETGQLHTELNIETSNYYMKIKEICNEGQREQLHRFFIQNHEGGAQIPFPARRHGRGQKWK